MCYLYCKHNKTHLVSLSSLSIEISIINITSLSLDRLFNKRIRRIKLITRHKHLAIKEMVQNHYY